VQRLSIILIIIQNGKRKRQWHAKNDKLLENRVTQELERKSPKGLQKIRT